MKSEVFLNTARQAALQAGEMLRKKFGTCFEISCKEGRHNLVTECDKMSENFIIDTIYKTFPTHAILAEESGASSQKNEVTWIIDPLDGTVNFAHTIPIFSVSIGVAVGNQVVCGVVYQPMTHELFLVEKGKGAFLNGTLLKVSSTPLLENGFVATGFPYNVNENPLHCVDTFAKLARQGIPIRRLGSAAIDLSYVAAGRFDAFWEVILQPWDYAAAQLLIEEAGGKVTDHSGKDHSLFSAGPILASNGKVHKQMSTLLT